MSGPIGTDNRSDLSPQDSLDIPNGSTMGSGSMNSSTTSLHKRGIPPQHDLLRPRSVIRTDSAAVTSQGRPQSPARTAAASANAQSTSTQPVTSQPPTSSHLSGLVCNVHRTTGKEPHALVGASTTVIGDKLFVFGGRRISRSRPVLTSELYELDLLHRHWTKVEARGDVPPPRYFHSVCALGDRKLVCYGGMSPEPSNATNATAGEQPDGQVSVMSDIHIYDVPTQTWTRIETNDMPQGRYAHCAAILPSSAVFSSAIAPLSALQHNPSSDQGTSGAIGHSIDGAGGAEMVVVGGQDSANNYIEQISIFNLRSLKWTLTTPMTGRSCGAYRSVVTPLTSMKSSQIGAGPGKAASDSDEISDLSHSGSPMLIYTNYNFLDVKLELQVRLTDGSVVEKPMQAEVSPPGLRFPSGGVIDNHFVVAGTFLTSSKQEFALWALDLRSLSWTKIDVASTIFSSGSWNRGVLWSRRNAFVILGNRKRNLVDDYNNRRLNFSNMCLVQLEAFGLYDNPRQISPTSDYTSVSAPDQPQSAKAYYRGGVRLAHKAQMLGEFAMSLKEIADIEILALDGSRVPVNSRLVSRRWGATFSTLMQDANPALTADTATLKPGGSTIVSRNSSITITPSINTFESNGTTIGGQSNSADANSDDLVDPAEPRSFPADKRPRIIYLPHTLPTINALLHYLYTSELPPISSALATPQVLCSLLQLARPCKIDGLLEAVVQRLHESLDGRNAAAIFNAAAMGAGGGDGMDPAAVDRLTHPPRNASLAGINIDPSSMASAMSGSDRARLHIDTAMANGVSKGKIRSDSVDGTADTTDDDDAPPGSASTAASMLSQMNSGEPQPDVKEVIWTGGWSAVIGLQKRGLRGLMEGRRLRERSKGTADGAPADGSKTFGTSHAAAGIRTSPAPARRELDRYTVVYMRRVWTSRVSTVAAVIDLRPALGHLLPRPRGRRLSRPASSPGIDSVHPPASRNIYHSPASHSRRPCVSRAEASSPERSTTTRAHPSIDAGPGAFSWQKRTTANHERAGAPLDPANCCQQHLAVEPPATNVVMASGATSTSNRPLLSTQASHVQKRDVSPAPVLNDFLRQQIEKQQKNNFHSTALRQLGMVSGNVNKTALHPGGVQPQREHTEIEEELHEKAHIDYDRVAIVANPSVAALYEDALVYETGSAITSTGALSAYSGAKTGRSPSDKRIVKEPSSEKEIWWGPVNKPMDPEVWKINRERAIDYLNTRNRIYVVDGFAGWDPRYRIKVRVIASRAYHALFMRNMLIRPSKEELEHFQPDYVIYNGGAFPANRYTKGMSSSTSVSINFAEREMVILGTEYAGEMKKGIFTVLFYHYPVNHGVLTMHSSANEGKEGDVTVFFGLSGTGKTTLSADPKRALIGDDEHSWSNEGIANVEGGCYAKTIGLSAEKEPDIFNAIRFGSILENVVFDPATRVVDYDDTTLTENTRCAYPIEFIDNVKIPCISSGHPKNIILLTCDARGVLPPVSKLTNEQLQYQFISGYTSKMAGTEVGVTEPQATFSTCFAAPFLALHPSRYAKMLSEKIDAHKANAWLINTGWVGAGAAQGGKRCPLKYTRAILDAIHSGELAGAEYETYETFNLQVPKTCSNVPDDMLNPAKAWTAGAESFKKEVQKLAGLYVENFKKYAEGTSEAVKAAGPVV